MVSTPGSTQPSGDVGGEPTRDLRGAKSTESSDAPVPPFTVRKDNITFDRTNPNIARAVRRPTSEVKEPTYEDYVARMRQSDGPDLIEGSDSARTGTTWGLPGVDNWPTVLTPDGEMPEGNGPGRASPNRNTGLRGATDPTYMVGSWSTIDDSEGRMSGGSPSGNA